MIRTELAPQRQRVGRLTRRRLLEAGCVGIVAGSATWFYQVHASRTEAASADALRRQIEERGGFRVVTDDLQSRIGPSVILPDRPVKLADLGPNRLGPMRSLAAALDPYPTGALHRLIDTVALAGDVVFWADTHVGGFYFLRGLCLNAGDPADAGAVTTRLFHHELSSLVRAAVPFDAARWTSFNPPGFAYLDEAAYRDLLKSHPHEDGDPALYAQGFIRPYGESDIDNDWNTYAEAAFGDGATFAAGLRPYPRMRGKLGILMELYRGFDPRFAAYFDRTGLTAAAAQYSTPHSVPIRGP